MCVNHLVSLFEKVRVKYATEHRCGIVVHGPGLSGNISGTDPLKDNLPLETSFPLDEEPNSVMTARVVNQVSLEIRKLLEVQHKISFQGACELTTFRSYCSAGASDQQKAGERRQGARQCRPSSRLWDQNSSSKIAGQGLL